MPPTVRSASGPPAARDASPSLGANVPGVARRAAGAVATAAFAFGPEMRMVEAPFASGGNRISLACHG